jgi:hypothetical protein
MRVICLLALFFGFSAQMIAAGQPFASAVFGIVCGLIAIACGLVSTRKRIPDRWTGFVLSILGCGLVTWCLITAPSAYAYEQRSNARKKTWAVERVAREADAAAETTAAKERGIKDGLTSWMSDDEILSKLGYVADTFPLRATNLVDGISVTYSNEATSIIISRSYRGILVSRFRPTNQQQEWMFGKP